MSEKVIRIPRRRSMQQKQTEEILGQFINREEYPELFGDPERFDFDVDHEDEKGLMALKDLEEDINAHNESIEDDGDEEVVDEEEVCDFAIIEG